MGQLIQMLAAGRLDALVSERLSAMTAIRAAKPNAAVYYRLFPDELIQAGMAVRKDAGGNALRETIEGALRKIDIRKLYQASFDAVALPKYGVVK